MVLKQGILFDGRFMLISCLGQGASAQVWLAKDTLANNLRVAIKIFSAYQGIDTIGIQNFKREFTYVYNIQHQNLLTPTNYAICDGTPYLVLPYCENGSATSMLGRADENDIIKFLHDVAAALECLHAHNIVHQDIKPDNVLLDDDCNFLVTDFGISTQSVGNSSASSGSYGGTRAYMGPERFEKDAVAINMNDIWALGATAYEMITGNPPFGDNGGMVQAMGESVPDLSDTLQPDVRQLIMSCLEAEPWNRPSAEVIRKKTQLYLETGSWKEKDGKKYLYGSIVAAVLILLVAGLWVWDYNRTKVFYYKDYAEFWGVPKGLGHLSGSEMKHRGQTYRMEYSQRKLRRLSLVNSEGNLVSHEDTETMLSRFTDVHFFYTDDGKVDYKTVYDQAGKLLFKMDYDESLKTVTFRQNDEYGTEMNLRANTTDRLNQGFKLFEDKSRISRYLLNYDEKGLLLQQLYVGLQNVPAGDKENIYGIKYKYDEKGRKIEEQYLGVDKQPTSNGIGLSITQYDYDKDDNWCAVRYLNIEGQPSHDGNNCPLVKIESDEWGNRVRETYYSIDGTPSIRMDYGVSGFSYIYDDNGHRISSTCLGTDGNRISCKYGFTIEKCVYDENGYLCQCSYFDADGNPTCTVSEGDSYSRIDTKNNEKGFPIEMVYFDEEGKESDLSHGCSKIIFVYDSLGNRTEVAYWNSKHKPALYDGLYSKINVDYDEFSRVVSIKNYDEKGKPAINDDGIHIQNYDYNRQGAIIKMSFFGTDGKPCIGSTHDAIRTFDYDDLGNQKTIRYYDTEGHLTNNLSGIARSEFYYDSKTNFLTMEKSYDMKGALLSEYHLRYDKRGNVVKRYVLTSSGHLRNGTAVEHKEYDNNNRPIIVWFSDLKDKPVHNPGTKISKIINKYDARGNVVEMTCWNAEGKPSVDEQGAFKKENRYNDLGLLVYERNFDASGKPLIGRDVNPEGKAEYDKQGNLVCVECYDGYGKPRLSADGFFRSTSKYNSQNKPIENAFYGLDGKLIKSRSNEYARKTTEYNRSGMETQICYYNEQNKVFRYDTYKYNERNRLLELLILDEKKHQDDKFWGYSKLVVEYNKTGLIPKKQTYYNKSGAKLGYQEYDESKKAWGKVVGLNVQNAFNVVGDHWKQVVRETAALCPMDVGNGVQIRSMSIDGNTVNCVARIAQLDLDALDEEQLQQLKQMLQPISNKLKKVCGIPSSVQFVLIFQDKNGKRI